MMNNSDMPAMPHSAMKPNSVYQQEYAVMGADASMTTEYTGLSKREHFAAMAMQGMVSGALANGSTFDYVDVADFALKQADALLKELDK